MDTNGKFYLGRIFDPKQGKTSDQILLYEPADLTTHAVVVGMTGSGKTGLCIDLLEEAALKSHSSIDDRPEGRHHQHLAALPQPAAARFSALGEP